MLRTTLQLLVWTAAFGSLIGLTAPVFPLAELTNHARPVVLLGCLMILPVTYWFGSSFDARKMAVLCVVNAALCSLPLLSRADTSNGTAGATLKIVSFNMEYSSNNDDQIVAYLRDAKPDIVLLQELLARRAGPLFARLTNEYPSQVNCPPGSGCILGLLAKAPMVSSGYRGRTETAPPQVWAEFLAPQGPLLRVVGLHLAFPLTPNRQARHVEALIQDNASRRQPTILAGDFNLTPWSWLLNKLAWHGQLRRHGLLAASWPADWPGIGPFLLIDNIMTSREIKSVSFEIGPALGSDHRPIVATVSLP